MLNNSKSSVSLLALFASLASWPAHAQNAPAQTETVVVTGSRVITNIANSPTPMTTLSSNDLEQMIPTSV